MNKYAKRLIESSLKELDTNPKLSRILLERAEAVLAADAQEIKSKEEYVNTLLHASEDAANDGNSELAEAMITEALTVVDAEDPEGEQPSVSDNTELINKMNSLVNMLEKFFGLFFFNRLPTDLKKREEQDIKEFKANKSAFQRSFKVLREGIEEFQKIQLTEEESDKIEKYLKFLKPLKNIPETPID